MIKIAGFVFRPIRGAVSRALDCMGGISPRMVVFVLKVTGRLNEYQPIPWLGVESAIRGDATWERWAAIEKHIHLFKPGSAMDLGAQAGFFAFKLAESGYLTQAIETSTFLLSVMREVQRVSGLNNVAIMPVRIDSKTVHDLPRVDLTIFLSLWHHLCRAEGYDVAKDILREVLGRTKKVCFFETGQSDELYMKWSADLPIMEPDPQAWIMRLLKECGAKKVVCLGKFKTHLGPVNRYLFAAYTSRSCGDE